MVHCIYKRWRDCIFTGIRNDYKIEGLYLILCIPFFKTLGSKCSIVYKINSVALKCSAETAGS